MRIIGLTGYARAGKDTVAGLIRDELTVRGLHVSMLSFAAPLKNFCAEVFGFSHEQLHGNERDTPDPRWTRPDGTPLTARFALQTLGTEWGRNCDPEVWVKSGVQRAARSTADVCVFSDVRFPNEAAAIQAAGGEVWRVRRGAQAHAHESEAHVFGDAMTALVTREIPNTGSLDDLWVTVRYALGAPCAAFKGVRP